GLAVGVIDGAVAAEARRAGDTVADRVTHTAALQAVVADLGGGVAVIAGLTIAGVGRAIAADGDLTGHELAGGVAHATSRAVPVGAGLRDLVAVVAGLPRGDYRVATYHTRAHVRRLV